MDCPRTHELYELERGTASREEADVLRRHMAECEACRAEAADLRDVAAALERLAGRTRADLPPAPPQSVLRRARIHGWLGRPMKSPLAVRMNQARWVRISLPVTAAIAGAILIVVGLQISAPEELTPRGALERLARDSNATTAGGDLPPLSPVARAAAAEELARPDPSLEQVADLLLVAYITQRPHSGRQVHDVRFLVDQVWSRRRPAPAATASLRLVAPILATVAMAEAAQGLAAGAAPADPRGTARSLILSGDYAQALAALPSDDSAAVLKAWCLASLGRSAEAVRTLAKAEGDAGPALARVLRADLALQGGDVAEAMRQYETLAAQNDRFWFPAGYLCRYELADPRGAGLRFARVRDTALAAYVAQAFEAELAAVKEAVPAPLVVEDFGSYEVGTPGNWALVRTRCGEFHVTEVPGGKALRQDEINCRGAELLLATTRDWSDYTFRVDVKVLASQGDYVIGAATYRRPNQTGYVLEVSPHRLRLQKQFGVREDTRKPAPPRSECLALEPMQAQVRLDEPPVEGWWYTLKIRVQRVDNGVSVAGKVWRTDTPEPLGWQVVWTDTGQGRVDPIPSGACGVQISGAKVLIDNLIVTANEVPKEMATASR